MNNIQRSLLAIFIPMTILILIFDHIIPKDNMVNYVRYAIMISLFLVAISIKKKFSEQKLMALSFFFLVIADFFLVFCNTIDKIKMDLTPFGIAGFALAYICLILAYQKNFGVAKKAEIISAILMVIISIMISMPLFSYVKGIMKIGAIGFSIVLSYMTWSSICTIFRSYYKKKIAIIIAISGTLMYICDFGVAYSLFHPYYSTVYIPLLKNIIWMAYIIGWTLLDITISEEDLKI
jgi:hypothetical protein